MKKFILMLAMGCFCSNLVAVASGDNGGASEKPKSREVKLQGVIKRPQGGRSIVLQPCIYAYMGDNTLTVDLSAKVTGTNFLPVMAGHGGHTV